MESLEHLNDEAQQLAGSATQMSSCSVRLGPGRDDGADSCRRIFVLRPAPPDRQVGHRTLLRLFCQQS